MPKKKSQKDLDKWTKEDWGSDSKGGRYLPKKARKKLTSAQKAAGNRKKRKATASGKKRASYTEAERKAFLRATSRKRAKKSKEKK